MNIHSAMTPPLSASSTSTASGPPARRPRAEPPPTPQGPKREAILRAALADGRALVGDPRERLRRFARLHLGRLGRDRNLAIVFQVELRQSTKFMERFSATLLRDYLGLIRSAIADGQREGLFRADVKPTTAAKVLFGALDEMATNWILSKRRSALEPEADAVLD